MPKVFNRQPRAFYCCGVRLMPGKGGNDLPEEKIAELQRNPQFQSWCSLGWIGVKQQPIPVDPPEPASEPDQVSEPANPDQALVRVNVVKAREMIAECRDPELLLAWFEADNRQTVQAAIEKRIRALEAAAGEPVSEPEDGELSEPLIEE